LLGGSTLPIRVLKAAVGTPSNIRRAERLGNIMRLNELVKLVDLMASFL
jgi:hypothetical protein